MSETIRKEVLAEIKQLAYAAREKARALSKAGDEKNARRAQALAKVADIWAEEWK